MSSRGSGDGASLPPAGAWPPARLDAGDLRAADFRRTWRGFDPAAVRQLLGLVADEVLRLRQQLAAAHAEADRIKRGLRQWQTDHATSCRGPHLRDPNPAVPPMGPAWPPPAPYGGPARRPAAGQPAHRPAPGHSPLARVGWPINHS